MPKEFTHRDFLLKDITVTLGSGRSGAFLPADDTQPPPSPISPIAVVFANVDLFVAVRAVDKAHAGTKLQKRKEVTHCSEQCYSLPKHCVLTQSGAAPDA